MRAFSALLIAVAAIAVILFSGCCVTNKPPTERTTFIPPTERTTFIVYGRVYNSNDPSLPCHGWLIAAAEDLRNETCSPDFLIENPPLEITGDKDKFHFSGKFKLRVIRVLWPGALVEVELVEILELKREPRQP